ncbi:MAG: hypothetical protein JXD18_12335 [Anaerolineae bacterium]|nr:hypothetical protein [Anaerolineae bacterium]
MNQTLLAIRWYLALQLFGLAALPLTLRLFRNLPGRGYAFARALGLLLGGWVFWMLLTFGWLPNTSGAIVLVLGLLAAAGAVAWRYVAPGESPLSWRHILVTELLLALAFAAWCLVRAHMPRIETAGGEKWMEIAFLNAILRAPSFPPHDPWLSGFGISYYYFGYVIVAMLVRLSAVPATIGFNLGIATLFTLACTGAYGLVYSLLAAEKRPGALWWGLLGPLLLTVTGNLEGLLEVFHARGLFSARFWQWLDIRSLNVPPPALADGAWMPTRYIWWWQASRVLHDYFVWHTPANPAEAEVIDEFPAFSFLLGDMHAHVLALPFVLLALALALSLIRRKPDAWTLPSAICNLSLPLHPWELIVYALCLGGLGFLNTWDFPIYLFVILAAYFLSAHLRSVDLSPYSFVAFVALLAVDGFVFYMPFWLSFQSQAAGLLPNVFNGTRLPQFLVMFGPLAIPLVSVVIAEARNSNVTWRDVVAWALVALVGLIVFLALAALISPVARQYLTAFRTGAPIPGLSVQGDELSTLVADRLRERLLSLWTPLALAVLLVTALLTLIKRPANPQSAFILLLILTGLLLTLSVEFVYLRDNFGTRMNTIFKFYFQAWVTWSLAAAYGLARLLGDPLPAATWRRAIAPALGMLALLLVFGGLVYPALAIPTRAREHGGTPTLDGAAHLYEREAADFAAIDWLNAHVTGAPTILEAPGGGYAYEGRVSAFTGLPTVLGWAGHEHQWRGSYEEPGRREPAIDLIYSTTRRDEALTLIDQYGIRYIYVGPVERNRYPAAGLAKFASFMDVVYDSGEVTIYSYHEQ